MTSAEKQLYEECLDPVRPGWIRPCRRPRRRADPVLSEPDSLHVELDIRTPEDPAILASIAQRWLEAGLRSLAGDQVQALLDAPALPARSLPGTPWGSLVVAPDDRKRQVSLHSWTPRHVGAVPGCGGLDAAPDGGRALPAR